MDFKTECEKCYFRIGGDNQIGCERGRLTKWIEKGKTTEKPQGHSHTINTICNTYCETEEHASHIDDIIFPTCDVVILSVSDHYIGEYDQKFITRDIIHTCKKLAAQDKRPNTVTVVCDHPPGVISYSELLQEIDNVLGDITHKLITFIETKSVGEYIDEACRKTKGRYIYTIQAGDLPQPDFLNKLNKLENIDLTSFLAITYNTFFDSPTIIARCAYEAVFKNKEEPAIVKLIERAKQEKMEHMIISWYQLQ